MSLLILRLAVPISVRLQQLAKGLLYDKVGKLSLFAKLL